MVQRSLAFLKSSFPVILCSSAQARASGCTTASYNQLVPPLESRHPCQLPVTPIFPISPILSPISTTASHIPTSSRA
ncbi:hypothetical protein F5Y01DRAFT_291825 [Xylaria sp. FL0043]|nr:hypothetical protein F5Y01DRAFT_291825 [Xylaria sp. FL0043]